MPKLCYLLALAVSLLGAQLLRAAPPSAVQESAVEAEKADTATATKASVRRSGSWVIEDTENFSICRPVGYQAQAGMAAEIEKLRTQLCGAWQTADEQQTWNPRCQIVIHARLEGYLKEVGPGAGQTTGSSLIDFDGNRVAMRRIDIRGDRADWLQEALAHEMTHIVLADRFTHVQIPHWADEGMAIQADTHAKRRLHGRDLQTAVAAGKEFRLAELLMLDQYPHPSRMGTFYGQSASLVDYLTRIGTKEELVRFVLVATDEGYDVALRKVYEIGSVAILERQWRRHMRGLPPEQTISHRAAQPNSDELAAVDPTDAGHEGAVPALVE